MALIILYSLSLALSVGAASTNNSMTVREYNTTISRLSRTTRPTAEASTSDGIAGYVLQGLGGTSAVSPQLDTRSSETLGLTSISSVSKVTDLPLGSANTTQHYAHSIVGTASHHAPPSLHTTSSLARSRSSTVSESSVADITNLPSNGSTTTSTVDFRTNGTTANSTVTSPPYTGYETSTLGLGSYTTYHPGGEAYLSCLSQQVSWRVASDLWAAIQITAHSAFSMTTELTPFIGSWLTTSYPTDASTYTLCDGTPRADVKPVVSTSFYTNIATWTYTVPYPATFEPQPECTIDAYACEYLYDETSLSNTTGGSYWLANFCGVPVARSDSCIVQGGPVRLLYWPVTTVDGDLCSGNGSTLFVTPTASRPNTFVTLGTTLTSPTVYISFSTLCAYKAGFSGAWVGPTLSDTIIPFPETAVSTQCLWTGDGSGNPAYLTGAGNQLNFADLNYPVPASAYHCMRPSCSPPSVLSAVVSTFTGSNYTTYYETPFTTFYQTDPYCFTIYDDFNPILAAPTALTTLIPEWSSCKFATGYVLNTWWDPPKALQQETVAAEPTVPTQQAPTTPASPSSKPDTVASETVGPVPQTGLLSATTGNGLTATQLISTPQATSVVSSVKVIYVSPSTVALSMDSDSGTVASTTATGTTHVDDDPTKTGGARVVHSTATTVTADEYGSSILSGDIIAPSDTDIAVVPATGSSDLAMTINTIDAAKTEPTNALAVLEAALNTDSGSSAEASPRSGDGLQRAGGMGSTDGSFVSTRDPGLAVHGSGSTPYLSATERSIDPSARVSRTTTSMQRAAGMTEGGTVPWTTATSLPVLQAYDVVQTVVLDGETLPVLQDPVTPAELVIGGQTLYQGGAPATVGSHTLSLAPAGIVVDGSSTVTMATEQQDAATVDIEGQFYTAYAVLGKSNVAVVDDVTLTPGIVRTIGGHVISNGPSGLVFDGTRTVPLYRGTTVSQVTAFELQGQMITAHAASDDPNIMVVDGKTVSIGQAITIGAHVISAISQALVLDGTKTISLAEDHSVAKATTFELGAATFTAYHPAFGTNRLVLNGITFAPGQRTTIDGHTFSVLSDDLVVDGTKTLSLADDRGTAKATTFALAAATFTAYHPAVSSGLLVLNGITLAPGQRTTIDEHTFSVLSDDLVVDGSRTIMAPTAAPLVGSSTFHLGEEAFTVSAAPGSPDTIDINGLSLSPGGVVALDGHVFRLLSDGSLLIDSSSTWTLAAPTVAPLARSTTFRLGGKVFTVSAIQESPGTVDINGFSLSPGNVVALDGHIFRLLSDGNLLVDNSSTLKLSALATAAPATTQPTILPTPHGGAIASPTTGAPALPQSTASSGAMEGHANSALLGLSLLTCVIFVLRL